MTQKNLMDMLHKHATKANAKAFSDYQGLSVCYLIMEKNTRAIKIGSTKNLQRRLTSYRTHNPFFTLVDLVEGNKATEKALQTRLVELGFTQPDELEGTEWYEIPKGITKRTIQQGFSFMAN
jgi:hypothetical protein